MASKALLVLGVLLAVALLASVQAATEKPKEKDTKEAGVIDEKYGGYHGGGGGYPGGGGGYPGGGGGWHGGYPGGGYPGGGHPGGGRGRCYYGCCRRGYYGGCQCCKTADDMPEAAYLPDIHH